MESVCTRCLESKSIDHFHKDKSTKNGRRYICKTCANLATRSSYRTRDSENNGLTTVWWSMKQRCYDKKHKSYHRYGARGITICKEWLDSLDVFVLWANSTGYSNGLQIDRIDNDGSYCPENCQWLTPVENSRKSPATKLTMEKAEEIRRLISIGVKNKTIAEQFGVVSSLISNIKAGKAWRR